MRNRGQIVKDMSRHETRNHDTANSVDHNATTRVSSSEQPDPPSALTLDEVDNLPPDGGYGWVCVLACFLVNFATWGVVAVRVKAKLRSHWQDANYFVHSLTACIYQSTSPPIGTLAHHN